jgi:ribosome-associated toxin RatA of RatAB toxin-antitoxin module
MYPQNVKNEYKHAREGPYQVITFDSKSDSITLDIPLDGKAISNGWKLIPLVHPEVILIIKFRIDFYFVHALIDNQIADG